MSHSEANEREAYMHDGWGGQQQQQQQRTGTDRVLAAKHVTVLGIEGVIWGVRYLRCCPQPRRLNLHSIVFSFSVYIFISFVTLSHHYSQHVINDYARAIAYNLG